MVVQNQPVERAAGRRLLIDKVFFGQKSAFKLQYSERADAAFFSVGRKESDDSWSWRTAKMNDTELAEILRVLARRADSASFYHTFNKTETRIRVDHKDDSLVIRIEDAVKLLSGAEQEILRVLIEEIIRQAAMAA